MRRRWVRTIKSNGLLKLDLCILWDIIYEILNLSEFYHIRDIELFTTGEKEENSYNISTS